MPTKKLTLDERDRLWREATVENMEFDRRKEITDIVAEFSGENQGHALWRLAREILRLRNGYWQLSRAVTEIEAGKSFHIMREGPYGLEKYNGRHKQDLVNGFYDGLVSLMVGAEQR